MAITNEQVKQSISDILTAERINISKLKSRIKDSGDYKFMPKEVLNLVECIERRFILAAKIKHDTSDFDSVVASLYLLKRSNAEQRGIEFNLTLPEVRKLIKRKCCYYSGRVLELGHVDNKPTFERLDNTEGYVSGNVVVAAIMNRLKNELFENPRSEIRVTSSEVSSMLQKLSSVNIKV